MDISIDTVTQLHVESFYQALNCPRSLTCAILFRSNEHDQLATLEVNPEHYNNVSDFADALAATKYLSKAKFLATTFNKEEAALSKFFEAERQCLNTNIRVMRGNFKNPLTPSVLSTARRIIDRCLRSFTAEELVDGCGWGPGATTLIKRRDASGPEKFRNETGITKQCWDFASPWIRLAYPLWVFEPSFQYGCKVQAVPKNAKTDRIIAVEPGINLWFQKGIGQALRKRLRYSGIDLDHGQDLHNKFARVASLYGHLATVDFSSASDTVSTEVVRELLPPRWFAVMDAVRSKVAFVGGREVMLHKFSSMGNGFTFELESLIFWAVAK